MKKLLKPLSLLLALVFFCGALGACSGASFKPEKIYADIENGGSIKTASDASAVSIENGTQKVAFENQNGEYIIKTYVKKGGSFVPFFDAGAPLLQGENFDIKFTEASVSESTKDKGVLTLSGENTAHKYSYTLTLTAQSDSPLIYFDLNLNLNENLPLSGAEPFCMLWRNGVFEDTVTTYMDSPCYQYKGDERWNCCFPYSYIWQGGLESAIFFDMNRMDWFSNSSIRRFREMQVRTTEDADAQKTGIGLAAKCELGGRTINKGDINFSFWLYGSSDSKKPSKLECLGKGVNIFGRCFPSDVTFPENQVDAGQNSYEWICQKLTPQLMLSKVSYQWAAFDNDAHIFKDEPVFPENTVSYSLTRPSYAANMGGHATNFENFSTEWNCCNNTVTAMTGFLRLFPELDNKDFTERANAGLKTYYDRGCKIFRSFASSTAFGFGSEFTFQNFFFGMSSLNASYMIAPENFDPALSGKVVQSYAGYLDIGKVNNYLMPQLFKAYDKSPATSIDQRSLGAPITPWSVGIYAYDMCMAHQYTGDKVYLTDAENAVRALFEKDLSYTQFGETLTDPYDFGVNESSDAPWGVAAAQYLYEVTGDKIYLTYSDHFRNISLRLMRWYESDLALDKQDCALGSAGLFSAFASANSPTPWENIYCYLPLTAELKNEDIKQSSLMLNMFNQYRANNFNFCIAFWDKKSIQNAQKLQRTPCNYMVSEDFYFYEQGGAMGNSGPCVYMSNTPYYAYYMYEAFGKTDDNDIMTLNLDFIGSPYDMINGTSRSFIVYNPTEETKSFTFYPRALQDADYEIKVINSNGSKKTYKHSASEFTEKGIALTLEGGNYLRIKVALKDKALLKKFEVILNAQKQLSYTYAALQSKAEELRDASKVADYKPVYLEAEQLYKNGDYEGCINKLSGVAAKITAIK